MLGFDTKTEKPVKGSDLEKHVKAARKFLKIYPEVSKPAEPEALIHFMQMKKKEKVITQGFPTEAAGSSCPGSSSSSHVGPSASEAALPKASCPKKKKKGGVARIAARIKKLEDKPEHERWEHDVARLWNDRYMRAGGSKKRKKRQEEKKKCLEMFEEI
jgi:hypothetical protein